MKSSQSCLVCKEESGTDPGCPGLLCEGRGALIEESNRLLVQQPVKSLIINSKTHMVGSPL